MVLFGTRGPLLCRVIRGAYSWTVRLGARGTQSLTSELRLILEPQCPRTGLASAGENLQGRYGIRSETLSCLWFQILGVKHDSFLPHCEGDRDNLPRQSETGHLWPHPFGHQSVVEFPEGPL